ncbi:hypothetical protein [Variovorax sp. UC74_104]|uniref:hypothetical protein n=1 Tax=Variovorax sp. UC74_104 TaxID=3374555 RepID=UPI00375828F7
MSGTLPPGVSPNQQRCAAPTHRKGAVGMPHLCTIVALNKSSKLKTGISHRLRREIPRISNTYPSGFPCLAAGTKNAEFFLSEKNAYLQIDAAFQIQDPAT